MAPRTVSFPMYRAPAAAMDEFWQGLRRHLLEAGIEDAAEDLSVPGDLTAHWLSPDLLLSQTCGYPLTHALAGSVRLVATPCYSATGCEQATYSSLFLVRQDDSAQCLADLRGRRVAFNSRDSQSGYNALRAAVAPTATGGRFFAEAIETGSHGRSMRLLANGEADLAAVDCITFALADAECAGVTKGLRAIGHSDAVPGLPLITAAATSDDDLHRLRDAFAAACRDVRLATARADLLLSGYEVLPLAAYDVIPAMAAAAERLSYPKLQ